MRSKKAKQIFDNTPQELKNKVRKYVDEQVVKNEHKKEADRLIEFYYRTLNTVALDDSVLAMRQALEVSLNDVENTIKVLDKMNRKHLGRNIEIQINFDFQTKVRDILKNKLK